MSSIATCDQGPSQLLLRNRIIRGVISWNYKTSLEQDIVLLFLQVLQMTKFKDLHSTRNVVLMSVPHTKAFQVPGTMKCSVVKITRSPFCSLLPKIQCEIFHNINIL